ncbi:MAG: hypothetical protein ABSA97_10425 [Verrucomicrobiia bacterium]
MNDADKNLDELLKAVRVPERSPGYWENFPKRVTAQLAAGTRIDATTARHSWAWRFGVGTVCLILALGVGLWLKTRRPAEPNYAKLYREIEAMFPNQVRAIAMDKQGVRLDLADKPDVPASAPLLVNVCRERQCRAFITFSGQQIRVNGESWDVLANGQGDVLVVGKRSVWSNEEPTRRIGAYRIDAQPLRFMS